MCGPQRTEKQSGVYIYIYWMWGPQRTEKQSGVLTPWVSIPVQRGSSNSVSCAAEQA